MKTVATVFRVVSTFVLATLVVSAQASFFGPLVSTTMSTSVATDVSSYGTPTRYAVGVQFARRSATSSEYFFSVVHRIESGGYLTDFVKPSGGVIGKVNVVEVPSGAPVIVTTLDATAIELNAGLRLPILALDSIGTRMLFQFGIGVDHLLSTKQVADYSRIPEAERGSIPTQTSVAFEPQTGFCGLLGLAVSIPAGDGRFLIDLSYVVRQPTTIAFPVGTTTTASEQNIGWLVGRGLRIGGSYQFRM